jgi:hypothetical protein
VKILRGHAGESCLRSRSRSLVLRRGASRACAALLRPNLHRRVRRVAIVQRCQAHKLCNVVDQLPDDMNCRCGKRCVRPHGQRYDACSSEMTH